MRWGSPNSADIELLAGLGLGFLFLLAGHELDPQLLREKAGQQALVGWTISAVARGRWSSAALAAVGFVHAFVPVCIALTTTALGTLLPILREQNMLAGSFGRFIFAAGAVGELLPILAISLFLGAYKTWWEALIIASIAGLAFLLSWLTRLLVRNPGGGDHRREQARHLAVDAAHHRGAAGRSAAHHPEVRGRGRAGRVLRRHGAAAHVDAGEDNSEFEEKLDAVGYGFFIPVFFVSSGMALDVQSIVENPLGCWCSSLLLLVVRGAPALLVYRESLPMRERIEMMFLTATALPLLVALAEIGVDSGVMLPENAAALVGAGVLSIAIFPFIATRMHRQGAPTTTAKL